MQRIVIHSGLECSQVAYRRLVDHKRMKGTLSRAVSDVNNASLSRGIFSALRIRLLLVVALHAGRVLLLLLLPLLLASKCLLDINFSLLASDGAKDDIHFLERATLGLGDQKGKDEHASQL
jgi:hypothetical protein